MPRLFLGNFEFEHHLNARQSTPLTRSATRISAELASVWLSLAKPSDGIWIPEPPDPGFSSHAIDHGFADVHWVSTEIELQRLAKEKSVSLCPWGWTQTVLDWATNRKLATNSPTLGAVRLANSRGFSFALESEYHTGLPASATLHSLEDWEYALKSYSPNSRWVVKSEFGMSARERVLGTGRELTPSQIGWGRKRIAAGQTLFLEPWVESLAEAGLQFDVPPLEQGLPRLIGIAPLLTDSAGVYRGSRFDRASESEYDWSDAVTLANLAATRLQESGYFGPLGIDAMWYRGPEGSPQLRALQDINARWTMGRLSLGFRSRLNVNEAGAWVHPRCPAKTIYECQAWWDRFTDSLPTGVSCLRMSPLLTGQTPTQHASALLTTHDAGLLNQAFAELR